MGLYRQCYELCSTAAEFYIAGSDESMPIAGATDFFIEVNESERKQWLFDLVNSLVCTLPPYKRLSLYTNDVKFSLECRYKFYMAAKRLNYFEIYPIYEKRQKCPLPQAA